MRQMDKINRIVKQAIDIHVHVGPEIIPRKYTAASLAKAEGGKIAGAVLKNHFYPTTPFISEVGGSDLQLFGAVVLNYPVGGLNPEAIRAAALLSKKPILVWLPTIHAAQFLENSEYEIAPEWCSGSNIPARKASKVNGISLTAKDGGLTSDARSVAKQVLAADAVLATGHVSWQESVAMIEYALKVGVKRIVVTHPIYQKIDMPIEVQKKLADKGCFMEVSYSMYSIDKIPIKNIVSQIREIGPSGVIISSDVGQKTSKSPSESLAEFCKLLIAEKIPVEWLETMLVENPKKLLLSKR